MYKLAVDLTPTLKPTTLNPLATYNIIIKSQSLSTMPPRQKTSLGINDKDYTENDIAPDDFRRNWVSKNPFSARNSNPKVTANQEHHDFDHLNIPTPTPSLAVSDLLEPPNFLFPAPETEVQYLAWMRMKLHLAKDYILKEDELGLDPDRPGMHKEVIAVLLGQPPIKIDLNAQQCVRLLLDGAKQLRVLAEEKGEEDPEVKKAAGDYWELWTSLRASLAWQVPGKSEMEKVERADRIMSEVLEKIVQL